MSWFGGSGSNSSAEKSSSESTTFQDEEVFNSATDSSLTFGNNLAGQSVNSGKFEQEIMMEQQKALIQAVMFKLTEISFKQCVPKPSSSLSSSERACIQATVTKYLDATEFVVQSISQQR